jgi:5-formyltetrahydrofolate cyclo-ligase
MFEGDRSHRKTSLRAQARDAHRALDRAERQAQGADVARALAPWLEERPGIVALYLAMPTELPTGPLDDVLRAAGRIRCVPQIDGPRLRFRQLPDDLGVRDVPRPRVGAPAPDPSWPEVDVVHIAAWVVPGLLFDVGGGRLGRGAGFYDRSLAPVPRDRTVGVGYRHQLHPSPLPMEPHDVRLGAVCTPDGLWACGARAS